MLKKVIGIISWLPNDNTRPIRQQRLEQLLVVLEQIFALPIIVVAQNWDSSVKYPSICTPIHFDQLGITGARIKLREIFLASTYDYLIMLDDNAEVRGSSESAQKYLEQIDKYPTGIGIFKGTLLKFFAISKDLFQQVEYENVSAAEGEGFEDIIFVEKCKILFPQHVYTFKRHGLDDLSNSASDEYSTWWKQQYEKKEMKNKSFDILNKFTAKLNDNN